MIPLREAIAGAVLITVLGITGIFVLAYITIPALRESYNMISATRVAHNETHAELADTYSELAMTLVELHECESKPTN